jgi:hypothetical protein
VGQGLQQALTACNDPSVTSFLTGTIPAVTAFDTSFSTPTDAVVTPATQAAGTTGTAGTTAAASTTGKASTGKTSGAGKNDIVFVAAVMVAAVGCAFIGI